MAEKRTVYIVGHKNPDTDSICSAISYAYLKTKAQEKRRKLLEQAEKVQFLAPDHNTPDVATPENEPDAPGLDDQFVPCRAGAVSAETQYVLDRFHFMQPRYLENIGTRVKDMEIRKTPGVDGKISVKDAWELMKTQNVFTLPIIDGENHLEGLVTTNDIAKSYMDENDPAIVSVAKTPFKNILKTLEATMVVGDPDANFEHGKVVVAAANPDVMEHYIEKNDCVILGNRYESQLMAILAGAGCIIVCLEDTVSKTIQHMAREHGTTILVTKLDTYNVARLINQSMPIDFFMKSEQLMTFEMNDYTDVIQESMLKKRYRDFPILDKNGVYIGTISRRNLLGVRKRALILVDHNEIGQAVDNVENAEILEIIDHHRLGSLETVNPVFFRNEPVGCTATIVWQMFHEKDIEIPENIAGLLCSAILSDTLAFRSPTCTVMDRIAAKELASIAGIDPEKHAKAMFKAGSKLREKTPDEIFYNDFKTFDNDGTVIGIGQVTSMSQEELDEIKDRLKPFIEKKYKEKGLDIALFMLTNIINESTTMLCYGEDVGDLVNNAFNVHVNDNVALMQGIVSRKKQVVPGLMDALNRDQEI